MTEEIKKDEEVQVPEKFAKIVEEISNMSVLDLSELVGVLEKKFGVSASMPMAVVAPVATQAGGDTDAEEKSSFDIELSGVGDKKIEVIKIVRDITGKGLKEAKDLVDGAINSPQIVSEGVSKEDAEEIKKKFEAAGATITLK
ncbi:MAG: 50S ribosomal protein L7 [Parcubacteria group bacterium ADurb.Bin247]|jgi:large subunit ribosomal protein L7/L12|nr:MAG: 50S ribosomal protein L7 [Parcubacteria group bacterium ADurb.Bin247]HQB84925.1 50S ribosomal protein L7/L12 [Candidatus Pacearchaeota archaeon]